MRKREWERIIRQSSMKSFARWLLTLKGDEQWNRGDICGCPLHDFIEWASGESLCVNSPDLSEHWHERDSQTWPTPWWMVYILRSVDHSGSGKIGCADLCTIYRFGLQSGWREPLNKKADLIKARAAISEAGAA